jgi:hypothetical protein
MKMDVTLGHPILIFLYSLALLVLGGAIGIRWGASWGSIRIAVLGAVLMIVHDWMAAIVWSWKTATLIGATHRDRTR